MEGTRERVGTRERRERGEAREWRGERVRGQKEREGRERNRICSEKNVGCFYLKRAGKNG